MSIPLAVLALLLVVMAGAIFRRQARASQCSRHNRLAGRLAVVTAWGALLLGLGALVYLALL